MRFDVLSVLVIQSERSQYSFPSGRSACTFIALAAAGCLGDIPQWNFDVLSEEPERIMEMGIAWYESASVYLSTEHSSTDEAIQALQAYGEGLGAEAYRSLPYDFNVEGYQQV